MTTVDQHVKNRETLCCGWWEYKLVQTLWYKYKDYSQFKNKPGTKGKCFIVYYLSYEEMFSKVNLNVEKWLVKKGRIVPEGRHGCESKSCMLAVIKTKWIIK